MLQWNPGAVNQETDAAYLADSQRSGGATNPSVFASILANKLFYQCTTYLTALFTALANKGFTTSDASLATLTTACANFLTTADVRPGLQVVTYAGTVVFDATQANGFQITLGGNLSFTVNSPAVGQIITFNFIQDASGGRVVTPPSNMTTLGNVDPTPGLTSTQQFIVLQDGSLRSVGPMTVN